MTHCLSLASHDSILAPSKHIYQHLRVRLTDFTLIASTLNKFIFRYILVFNVLQTEDTGHLPEGIVLTGKVPETEVYCLLTHLRK